MLCDARTGDSWDKGGVLAWRTDLGLGCSPSDVHFSKFLTEDSHRRG